MGKAYPKFVNEKWGWVVAFEGMQSVLYDGDVMVTFGSEEEAAEFIDSAESQFDLYWDKSKIEE